MATSDEMAEIRRVNLVKLIQDFKTKKAFAEHVGMSQAHLGVISSPLKRIKIGHEAARKMEAATDKPAGWLDERANGLPFDVDHVLSAIDALDAALAEAGTTRVMVKDDHYKKMLKAIIVRSYGDDEITIVQAKDYLIAQQIDTVTY